MSSPSITETFEMEEIDYRELNSARIGLKAHLAEQQQLKAKKGK